MLAEIHLPCGRRQRSLLQQHAAAGVAQLHLQRGGRPFGARNHLAHVDLQGPAVALPGLHQPVSAAREVAAGDLRMSAAAGGGLRLEQRRIPGRLHAAAQHGSDLGIDAHDLRTRRRCAFRILGAGGRERGEDGVVLHGPLRQQSVGNPAVGFEELALCLEIRITEPAAAACRACQPCGQPGEAAGPVLEQMTHGHVGLSGGAAVNSLKTTQAIPDEQVLYTKFV